MTVPTQAIKEKYHVDLTVIKKFCNLNLHLNLEQFFASKLLEFLEHTLCPFNLAGNIRGGGGGNKATIYLKFFANLKNYSPNLKYFG